MTYDGFTLAAVISELNSRLIGGKIQKIRQHNESDITLEIRVSGHTYNLFFSVDAKFPRTYLTATSAPVPQQAPNFCMVLRKYIEGSRIVSIKQVQMDRIMKLCLEYPDQTQLMLIFELMGKHSNLILVNSENKILGAIKHVGASVSRYRQVLPGRDYISPPTSDKVDIRQLDNSLLNKMWDASFSGLTADLNEVSQWLLSTFSGFGPFLADEVVKRAQKNDNVFRDDVISELISIREIVLNSLYEPVFITNERGEGLMVLSNALGAVFLLFNSIPAHQ